MCIGVCDRIEGIWVKGRRSEVGSCVRAWCVVAFQMVGRGLSTEAGKISGPGRGICERAAGLFIYRGTKLKGRGRGTTTAVFEQAKHNYQRSKCLVE